MSDSSSNRTDAIICFLLLAAIAIIGGCILTIIYFI